MTDIPDDVMKAAEIGEFIVTERGSYLTRGGDEALIYTVRDREGRLKGELVGRIRGVYSIWSGSGKYEYSTADHVWDIVGSVDVPPPQPPVTTDTKEEK